MLALIIFSQISNLYADHIAGKLNHGINIDSPGTRDMLEVFFACAVFLHLLNLFPQGKHSRSSGIQEGSHEACIRGCDHCAAGGHDHVTPLSNMTAVKLNFLPVWQGSLQDRIPTEPRDNSGMYDFKHLQCISC